MKVALISYTPDPELTVATAIRLCYSNADISELQKKIDDKEASRLIRMIQKLGHTSTLEHASFTFGIEGISRACSHQLVRHRIASYSQQSQRYVKLNSDDVWFVTPPSIAKQDILHDFIEDMGEAAGAYQAALENDIPGEDARFLLPNACETKIIVTMNARSLLNFFEHRLCTRAQWEIRAVAAEMIKLVKDVAPTIFESAGPHCVSHEYCGEGSKSCGAAPTLDTLLRVYRQQK